MVTEVLWERVTNVLIPQTSFCMLKDSSYQLFTELISVFGTRDIACKTLCMFTGQQTLFLWQKNPIFIRIGTSILRRWAAVKLSHFVLSATWVNNAVTTMATWLLLWYEQSPLFTHVIQKIICSSSQTTVKKHLVTEHFRVKSHTVKYCSFSDYQYHVLLFDKKLCKNYSTCWMRLSSRISLRVV